MAATTAKAFLCIVCGAWATAGASDLPPLRDTSPAGEHYPGKFVWADLFTAEPDQAQDFYSKLFGWEATTIERTVASGRNSYVVMTNHGDPVAGIARRPARAPATDHGRWIGYVSVPDVAKALAKATAAGGRVLFPAKDLPQRGIQAILIDPEGAEIGLLHSSTGDPEEFTPETGDWTWAQLFARNPTAEGRFYAPVAGWETLPDSRVDRRNVLILASGGYSRAGVAPLPPRPGARPGWLLLVRVANVRSAVAKATSLGARLLVAPSEAPTEYWRAVIADPTGAVIGLVQLQEPSQAEKADLTQPKEQP